MKHGERALIWFAIAIVATFWTGAQAQLNMQEAAAYCKTHPLSWYGVPNSKDGLDCSAASVLLQSLTNKDVTDLLKSSISPEIVIAKIRSSPCHFDTSPAALKELKTASVPDAVVLAMVEAPDSYKTHRETKPASTKESTLTPSNQPQLQPVRTPPLPPNTIRALGYRVVPQQNTTYYRSGTASAFSSCYGQGEWSTFGNFGNMNLTTDCNTTYTSPTEIPITWRFADVYNLVETTDQMYLIGCRAAWRWSSCSPLIPGDEFQFEMSGRKMNVFALKNGKKAVHVKYIVFQVSSRQ